MSAFLKLILRIDNLGPSSEIGLKKNRTASVMSKH